MKRRKLYFIFLLLVRFFKSAAVTTLGFVPKSVRLSYVIYLTRFGKKEELTQHLRKVHFISSLTSGGMYSYPCEICERQFPSQRKLVEHKASHVPKVANETFAVDVDPSCELFPEGMYKLSHFPF